MKRKSNAGRPLIKIDWDQFDKLCAIQCSLREIAAWFNCSIDTIERAVQREKQINFAEYFDQKRMPGKISIRRRQYEVAMQGNVSMLIWLGKNWLGQVDKQEVQHTGIDGGPIKYENISTDQLQSELKENLEVLGFAIDESRTNH